MAVHLLSDVDVIAISLVDKGANRRKFYLRKQEAEEFEVPGPARIVKTDDWSAVYCVVAEPGWRENPGIGAMTDLEDEWASPDEIRKAAHKFMKNGALVNKMHETLDPYGAVVENFVAQSTFLVGEEIVKEGAWVVGIEPNEEGKRAIEKGEFTGISIQGTGLRKLVEKASLPPGAEKDSAGAQGPKAKKCPQCKSTVKADVMTCQNCGYKFPATVKKVPGPPGTDIARNQAAARGPLRHLIAFYMKKPHPFTACVRDNEKRFGRERAERVCATLKDLGTGTTKWRHGSKKMMKADEIPELLLAQWSDALVVREGLVKADIEFILSGLEKQEGTLMPVEEHENTGWLRAIGNYFGISKEDAARLIIEEEESQVSEASDERLTGIEEAVTKTSADVKALADRLADIAEKLADKRKNEEEEEEAQPTTAEVYHRLDEVQKSLDSIHSDVEKLGEGGSHQPREERRSVAKSDHPLAGLLSEEGF